MHRGCVTQCGDFLHGEETPFARRDALDFHRAEADADEAFDLVLAEGLWYELRDRGVDVLAVRPGSTDTPGWRGSQPHAPDLRGVLTPSDVVRDALASLGQEPSVVPGVANRGAAAMFRGMERREVIEMMSSITSRLGPAGT